MKVLSRYFQVSVGSCTARHHTIHTSPEYFNMVFTSTTEIDEQEAHEDPDLEAQELQEMLGLWGNKKVAACMHLRGPSCSDR